ncbi:hypothetical protein [Hyphomonas sp.]|uniref:hypothetical protein n=1 Tax=Hyphomonas sp. TaxID=87 RepID=UPI0025C6E1F9|nr:hypothetical protein [Hyphomonas sp.]
MLRLISTAIVALCAPAFLAAAEEPAPLTIPVEAGLWQGEIISPGAAYAAAGPVSRCLTGEPARITVQELVLADIDPAGRCTIAQQHAITDHFIMTQIKCSEGAFTYGEIVTNGDGARLNVHADLSFGAEETAKPSGVVQISLAHAGACPAE